MSDTTRIQQNRLKESSSPYLIQHAENPVNWYEWGPEALEKALQEDKPIFLSIGYSACHWCHVMAHESFENEEIAALMNEHFINIKLDREERPDLDEIYMTAVQMLTGSGGWPTSIWLTPELKPFYGGTYFPPEDRLGMPGFKRVLLSLVEAWQSQRGKVVESAEEVAQGIQKSAKVHSTTGELNGDLLEKAFYNLRHSFDSTYGGFSDAPKFPQAMQLSFLFRYYYKTKEPVALEMAEQTLEKMALGGIYDHLGGGFHRYSTDSRWLVPHFEKMLYDQALLVRCYSEAFQLTKKSIYKYIVRHTLDYVMTKMTSADGGFYSAEDADSEGEEGKYYVWDRSDINDLLGEGAPLFCDIYGVTKDGNWEGKNILNLHYPLETVAQHHHLETKVLSEKLFSMRNILLNAREKRIRPFLDDKALTDWNSLMITAFINGYKITGNAAYLETAQNAVRFIQKKLYKNGELYHSFRKNKVHVKGFLSDYSFLISSLIDLYEVTFHVSWLKWAIDLTNKVLSDYSDPEGGFYYSLENSQLIVRSKNAYDQALPSGNSVMVRNLLRLSEMTGQEKYRSFAQKTLAYFTDHLAKFPMAYAEMLLALDSFLEPFQQIVITGDEKDKLVLAMQWFLYGQYVPNSILTWNDSSEEVNTLLPVTANKTSPYGGARVFVCENYTCKEPVASLQELEKLF